MIRHSKRKLTISIFILFLLFIGIGYAYLTSNLSITGATEIASNTWNIHFNNLVVSDNSVSATTPASINPTDNTSITYTVKLNRPKEFYEFTVDVVNEGSLPGKISISNLSGITTEASKVVDYSINYTDGKQVNIGDILNGGATKSIKVKVYYKDDIEIEDLPTSNLNLTLAYNLEYVQSEKDELTTDRLVQQLKTENSSCFNKYEGQVTDQVGVTKQAENVYFNKCEDKRNIIFNNMCWQMIRTTETGGIKMIYYGEPEDGKCVYTREDHKGIVQQTTGKKQIINYNYLYGDSFTYNLADNTFTLTNTETATWSDSTYENLIGKYTCKSSSDTCTTIYQINEYASITQAYLTYYKIANTNYAQIGKSSISANGKSLANVGYMFNKVYNHKIEEPTSGSLMGNDVTYANGTYTLLPAAGETELGTTLDNKHHYTCNSTSSTCSKVRYYFYIGSSGSYYIELDGEENIDEVVNSMLNNDDVNRYNSPIKGIIDVWYRENMLSKTNMLEDTVYCNARNIINQSEHGWNKDGSLSEFMDFKNSTYKNIFITCPNETDQFAVNNNKAKLIYPVGLATYEELYILTNGNKSEYYDYLTNTFASWWGISPIYFNGTAVVRSVGNEGNLNSYGNAFASMGIRLVVSLKSGAVITSGTGSEDNPFIILE